MRQGTDATTPGQSAPRTRNSILGNGIMRRHDDNHGNGGKNITSKDDPMSDCKRKALSLPFGLPVPFGYANVAVKDNAAGARDRRHGPWPASRSCPAPRV